MQHHARRLSSLLVASARMTLKSHASERRNPPAKACPLMAQMVMSGNRRSRVMKGEKMSVGAEMSGNKRELGPVGCEEGGILGQMGNGP